MKNNYEKLGSSEIIYKVCINLKVTDAQTINGEYFWNQHRNINDTIVFNIREKVDSLIYYGWATRVRLELFNPNDFNRNFLVRTGGANILWNIVQ